MQVLNLAGNDLGTVPSGVLAPLGNLHIVDMSGCGLNSVSVDAFIGLQRLQSLLMPYNNLTSLACLGANGAALPSLRVRVCPMHVVLCVPAHAACALLPSLQLPLNWVCREATYDGKLIKALSSSER